LVLAIQNQPALLERGTWSSSLKNQSQSLILDSDLFLSNGRPNKGRVALTRKEEEPAKKKREAMIPKGLILRGS